MHACVHTHADIHTHRERENCFTDNYEMNKTGETGRTGGLEIQKMLSCHKGTEQDIRVLHKENILLAASLMPLNC